MKTIPLLVLMGGMLASTGAVAQTEYRAVLTTAAHPEIPAVAGFSVEGAIVRFTITINLEDVVPTSAWLISPSSAVQFELGTPTVAIHSPGPWPEGYDGATIFHGTFPLPGEMVGDLQAGRVTLELRGTSLGDFKGPVLAASSPQISRISAPQLAAFRLEFAAQAPYVYRVERWPSLTGSNMAVVTNITARSQNFNAVVMDTPPGADSGFYRVRRDLCCDGR